MAHSEEVKAQAMAALLAGQSVGDVARQFRLPKQTVSRFKAGMVPFALEHATEEQRERLGELLLECMEASVTALTNIAQASSDTVYLKRQSARGLAALYREFGALFIRLYEAASAAGRR